MFKKTLLAATLAAMTSTAYAGEITVSGGAFQVGNEYLDAYTGSALEGDIESASIGITYQAGIALGIDNTLKFVFDGGAISDDVNLKLQIRDNTVAHADDAAVQTLIDAAVDGVVDTADLAADFATMKSVAISAISAANSTNAIAAIAEINALVSGGGTFAADQTIVKDANPIVIGALKDAADLVDFGTDDNDNYEWVLFKLVESTLVTDTLYFNDSDQDGSSNITAAFTKATIGNGDLTISMPEAKDGTGASLAAPVAEEEVLVTSDDQFDLEISVSEDTIDVEQDRQYFVDGVTTGTDYTHLFEFEFNENHSIDLGIDSANADYTITLGGNLAGVANINIDTASTNSSFSDDTYEGDNLDDGTIEIEVDGSTNLATRTITYSLNVEPSETDTDSFDMMTDKDAFIWGLNGSEIIFPYAPIGFSTLSTQFEVANAGEQEGDIFLSAFDNTGWSASGTVTGVTAESGKVVTLRASNIKQALGFTGEKKLHMTVTTTAPEDDIKITGYSTNSQGGRMSLLSDAYEK